jgi:hypothetical protein
MDMNADERMHGGTPSVPTGTISIYITLRPSAEALGYSQELQFEFFLVSCFPDSK